MKFCDERIQRHLLNGGKIIYSGIKHPLFLRGGSICFKNGSGEILSYSIREYDLTSYDWEIVEPEYDWDKIIKDKVLCEFSDNEDYKDDEKVISILTSIDEYRGFYYNSQGFRYKYCKPFNPSEYINVAEYLKEYEKWEK